MPKVGDTIQVTVNQSIAGGGGASISMGGGASMTCDAKILRDLGTHWEVELTVSIGGSTIIKVLK